jgi:hypothetical protein
MHSGKFEFFVVTVHIIRSYQRLKQKGFKITRHPLCNTTDVTSGAIISYPSGAPEFIRFFSGDRVPRSSVLCVVLCRSLLVLFLLGIVLSVLRITDSDCSLVSSNSSWLCSYMDRKHTRTVNKFQCNTCINLLYNVLPSTPTSGGNRTISDGIYQWPIVTLKKLIQKYLYSYQTYHICMLYENSSCESWIYIYLCTQCQSQLKLWILIPLMARCIRYNIMWSSLSVVSPRYSDFLH